MRILELCLAEGLGGLELYFHKCNVWLKHSEHIGFSATKPGTRLAALTQKDGIKNISLSRGGKIFPYKNAKLLAKQISNHDIDVVHIHHKDDLPLAAWAKVFSKKKFKLVHTRQMQVPHSKKDPYHRFIYRQIDLFITITDLLKKEVLSRVPIDHKKIKRLYYGVTPPASFNPISCNSFFGKEGQDETFKVGVFSRIEALKGHHLIVEAAQYLMTENLPIQFFIVGDVMDENYVNGLKEKIVDYGLENKIIFKGFHPAPLDVMPCCDLIIMPSKSETFGLVLIEAMRCGVAVIGTNSGGVPEIIDDNETGLLFNWGDAIGLAQQIMRLYQDPQLKAKLAQNGKDKADHLFDEGVHFRNLEKLFQDACQ